MKTFFHHDLSAQVTETGPGEITLNAEITIPAPANRVWQALTDYDRLAEFVPGMVASRLISDNGEKRLEQVGEYKNLLMRLRHRVVLRLEELPCERISFSSVEGDFNRFEGEWTLSPSNGETRLTYHVVVSPKFYVPHFLLGKRLKKEAERQINAVAEQAFRIEKEGRV